MVAIFRFERIQAKKEIVRIMTGYIVKVDETMEIKEQTKELCTV